ncbi:epoxide hydrolase 2 [Capsaspora owczarzaki ATCC 30864]|uniref:Epoxide hydrolase 2 n=1 Tax=Capsaspora owczarzaki (strain ATCC 30864) TaxID=595528 RepID=A0A0D2VNC4_CAPO3|nr:epoxide hydrolase 2 [Capsaspora owczarzaki ATCC 30864]KJE91802.1 epoxide hydrolase 2 [Capsaspora owczarzaki ATCC 30864]|eukprot:XP_004363725.2 epoxide hydrolase 2 [Capsaspora owczarzaki ATCC 30864]
MSRAATHPHIRAVLFDLGGVLVTSPLRAISNFERDAGLPPKFMQKLFVTSGQPQGAFARLERGDLLMSSFLVQFHAECNTLLESWDAQPKPSGVSHDNVRRLMQSMGELSLVPRMLQLVATIRNQGFKTALVTNNWIDDTLDRTDAHGSSNLLQGSAVTQLFKLLRPYFDVVVESCQTGMRKPDQDIYLHTCKLLDIQPTQAVFVDDLGHNVKAAAQCGMTAVRCLDPEQAVKDVSDLLGLQLPAAATNASLATISTERQPYTVLLRQKPLTKEDSSASPAFLAQPADWTASTPSDVLPFDPVLDAPACTVDSVPHAFVTTQTGHRIHYVELGEGPAIVLCHGWPELWYSWRHQIPALALAGFRVIALDQRGYGQSSAPRDPSLYGMKQLSEDVVHLLDHLNIATATVIGHDWGGAQVWALALHYPHRIHAVASINTPLMIPNPAKNPMQTLRENPGRFDYQLYFQSDAAVAELGANVERTVNYILRPTIEIERNPEMRRLAVNFATATKRGGLLAGMPDNIPPTPMLSATDLKVYTDAFRSSGFYGPLNWYRNMEANWRWHGRIAGKQVRQPALMVTAGRDLVLTPAGSAHMEQLIPWLSRGHIPASGHWTMQERPRELNRILVQWLRTVVYPAQVAKL